MKSVKVKVWDIEWDTDGENVPELPSEIMLELEDLDGLGVNDQDVADELSDRYGFCVNSFYSEFIE